METSHADKIKVYKLMCFNNCDELKPAIQDQLAEQVNKKLNSKE